MHVAADLLDLEQGRGLSAEGRLAKLRWAPGHAQRRVDRFLAAPGGERLERGHVIGRPGRADQRGPEQVGLGDGQLDRDPVQGDPDGIALALTEHRDDLGKLRKPRQHRIGP